MLLLRWGLLSVNLVFQLPSLLRPNQTRTDLASVTQALAGYQPAAKTELAFPGTFSGGRDTLFLRSKDGTEVAIYYFAKQTNGAEMIRGDNAFITSDDKLWKVLAEESAMIASTAGQFAARKYKLKSSREESRDLITFYCIADNCTSSLYLAKAFTALAILRGQGDHSVALAISSPALSSAMNSLGNDENTIVKKAESIATELRKFTSAAPKAGKT
jgi:EpsI family protein